MPKKSVFKELLKRRIPQIIGSYFIAGTSLVLFLDWLVDRYEFPQYYITIALFGIISIIPSVIILAYYHGAPGKDEWTKIEKLGIPINILFIGISLLVGYQYDMWSLDDTLVGNKLPDVHLLYIGSLEEDKYIGEDVAEYYLSTNEGTALFLLSEEALKDLRLNIESKLYSKFYNQNLRIQMLKSDEEISFINNTLRRYNNINTIVEKIYEFFGQPKHIVFIRVYAIKSNNGEILQYVYDVFGGLGGDSFTKRGRASDTVQSINQLESQLLNAIVGQITAVKNRQVHGEVAKIEGDYVYINPGNLILKNNMNLTGYRKWNHYDNDGDGFTDKDSSYYKWINDVKEVLDYMQSSDEYTDENIDFIQRKYNWLTSDSLRSNAKGETWSTHNYSLKVIRVTDSTVVTKLIELSHPWIKLNVGDGVRLD